MRVWTPIVIGVSAVYAALTLPHFTREAPSRAPDVDAGQDPLAASGNPRMARALELIRGYEPEASEDMIEAYAAWASEPQALAARRLLLKTLLRGGGSLGLSSALSAIEADATPPERDPLWNELLDSLSSAWQGPTIARGLDLMIAEARPRARRAVISSFAHLVNTERTSELAPEQRQTLVNHFIDLYPSLPPEQQSELDQALRSIASDDVADILLGRGLDREDELDGPRERTRALVETQRALAQVPADDPARNAARAGSDLPAQ